MDARDQVSTGWPSLQVTQQNLSYLSYGGFMGGWAAMSVSSFMPQSSNIRYYKLTFLYIDGNVFISEMGSMVVH